MKTRIIKTLFVVFFAIIISNLAEKAAEISQKYLALGQFDNSELSFQIFHTSINLANFQFFLGCIVAILCYLVWKPKGKLKN